MTPRPLPAPSTVVHAGPYTVTLQTPALRSGKKEQQLDFVVTRNGRPAQLGTYLGARGHLITLREGDLAYLHGHADEQKLTVKTSFPTVGRYRSFLQFNAGGHVRTAAFTFEVTR
jgi:hypothetical protein